jgi:hypothetical protein
MWSSAERVPRQVAEECSDQVNQSRDLLGVSD